MTDDRTALAALAARRDEDARWTLVAALDDRRVADVAIAALAAHGEAAAPYALAASHDPARRLGAAAVLARVASPALVPRLAALAADADPAIRAIGHAGLHRAGDRDAARVAGAIARDPSVAVLAVVAGRAADVAVGAAALDVLASQARAAGPPELRAGCAWAVAARDPVRGAALAGAVTAEPVVAYWLATVVARRGGALTAWTAGLAADPALDRVADLLGW